MGQRERELAAAAEEVVVAEGAKAKEGNAKEGKHKGKEGNERKRRRMVWVAWPSTLKGRRVPRSQCRLRPLPSSTTKRAHNS